MIGKTVDGGHVLREFVEKLGLSLFEWCSLLDDLTVG